MWQELINILSAIQGKYKEMLALSDKKRAVLVTLNVTELDKILKSEQRLTADIHSLEAKRQSVLRRLAEVDDSIKPDTKMSELCRRSPSPAVATKLKTLHVALDKIIGEVKDAGDNNRIIIEGALRAVNQNLRRIGGGATIDPSYGRRGQETVTHNKAFDFKA